MDDSQSSNRSEQCRTPSSSGYESATGGAEKRPITSNHQEQQHKPSHQHVRNYRHHGHHQQHLVELSPASDYRRQFVLGRLDRSPSKTLVPYDPDAPPCRIGKAHLIRHNPDYVTNIQMPGQQQEITTKSVPQPVWPARKVNLDRSILPGAVIKQDQNYVTKILIAPRTAVEADTNLENRDPEVYDSIVTHSLLMLTSYDGKSTDSCPASDTSPEEADGDSRSPAELAEIRKLSQTISQSRMVATVSRALSKSSTGSETYSARPPLVLEAESSTGGSIAKRISLMKERWEKNSRRRLLVESDDDDIKTYHTLDQRYVPQNGDLNFSSGLHRNGDNGFLPFSYLSGIQSKTIAEEVANDETRSSRLVVPQHQVYGDPYDEQDRLSNSSSRSSGSRRVTFSADTVDNEQSSKASSSSGSISGNGSNNDKNKTFHHQTIIQELKLNPQYLPHRYQHSQLVSVGVDRNRLAGYYSHNLQAHNELSYMEKYYCFCSFS